MAKRKLFDELKQGLEDIKHHQAGKITLKTYKIEARPKMSVTADLIRETREKLHLSRGVFARKIRVSLRTLERWEQGRSKPNEQASALIQLVRKYPDTIERLAAL